MPSSKIQKGYHPNIRFRHPNFRFCAPWYTSIKKIKKNKLPSEVTLTFRAEKNHIIILAQPPYFIKGTARKHWMTHPFQSFAQAIKHQCLWWAAKLPHTALTYKFTFQYPIGFSLYIYIYKDIYISLVYFVFVLFLLLFLLRQGFSV